MWKTLIIVLFALPTLASAALFYTPSGVPILVEEGATYEQVNLQTPSGFWVNVWRVLGPIKAQAGELSLKEQIKLFIKTWSEWNNVSPGFMLRLAECESGFNPEALNDHEVRGGNSYGLYQWQVGSWAHYNK